MANILEVKDLCKTYLVNKRQNNVLRNVTFNIEEGEMVAIMGPSGSGKSTLLYSVSGMDKATAGSVNFMEQDLAKLDENKLADIRLDEMGFIFQQMYMLRNLTIFDNIILPASQSKKHDDKLHAIDYALELVHKLGINDVTDNDITEVSGGQLQRACICRSLINKPKIIFADEPTGSLNRSASKEVMEMLSLINDSGTTIMLVTHDVKVASKCSRVMYIVDGNIKGEYNLSKSNKVNLSDIDKNRQLNNWLMEMGW